MIEIGRIEFNHVITGAVESVCGDSQTDDQSEQSRGHDRVDLQWRCQKKQMTASGENLPSDSDSVNQRVRDTTLGITDPTSSVICSPITSQRV